MRWSGSAPTPGDWSRCSTSTTSGRPTRDRSTADDGRRRRRRDRRLQHVLAPSSEELAAVVYATVTTDSRDERAQSLASQLDVHEAQVGAAARPTRRLGARARASTSWRPSAPRSTSTSRPAEPPRRTGRPPDERGRGRALRRAQHDRFECVGAAPAATSPRSSRPTSDSPTGTPRRCRCRPYADSRPRPIPSVRQAGYDAEMQAWPTVATAVAAAMNAIKGEANSINRRRHWDTPLDASLFANSVSRATFDAMQAAIVDALPDFRRWMRTKAQAARPRTAGCRGGISIAPLPHVATSISWNEGIDWVRSAFATYSEQLAGLVDRALDERWIDAEPRDGKTGGAFCMSFTGDRSLVLLNWSGSVELRPDDGPRTRPRLSQHHAGRPHRAPEAGADGARRDRQHLLRDTRRRGRPQPTRRPRTAGAARRRSGRARIRSSSTSTRGSCSRPRSSRDVNAARSVSTSSTS